MSSTHQLPPGWSAEWFVLSTNPTYDDAHFEIIAGVQSTSDTSTSVHHTPSHETITILPPSRRNGDRPQPMGTPRTTSRRRRSCTINPSSGPASKTTPICHWSIRCLYWSIHSILEHPSTTRPSPSFYSRCPRYIPAAAAKSKWILYYSSFSTLSRSSSRSNSRSSASRISTRPQSTRPCSGRSSCCSVPTIQPLTTLISAPTGMYAHPLYRLSLHGEPLCSHLSLVLSGPLW